MHISSKREALILFGGDLASFIVALWLTLFVRYGTPPNADLFYTHLVPFSYLVFLWVLVFFIAGLYEKHTIFFKNKLLAIVFKAELVNAALAVLFFYFFPFFGIAPKRNLFIYLFFSFIFVLLWRLYVYALFGKGRQENALLIGSGNEMRELRDEVNSNRRYGLRFISSIDLDDLNAIDFKEEILKRIYAENVALIAVDLRNEKVEPIIPHLYNLIFSKVRFVDMHIMYEDIFDRVPLSLLRYNWFIENISASSEKLYDFLKRLMDIVIALPLLLVSAFCYPFVLIAVTLEDRGAVFIRQERVGKNKHPIQIFKFRTMSYDDGGKKRHTENNITKTGAFLRKTRLDEFPQLWNVLRGDLSLIGPRPELPELVTFYEKEIPYYNIRHLIKPGLSGWAQLYHKEPPKFALHYDQTKTKLSYDLYYIKNRSLLLDIKIALKTLKILLSRSGI